jgi:hypothetical protein
VADSAAGNFDYHFIRARITELKFHRYQRLTRARHHPTNRLGTHQIALQLIAEPWAGTRSLLVAGWGRTLIKIKEKQKNAF